MKNQPNKVLLALALCFGVSVAYAGDNNDSKYNHNSKDKQKESSGKSNNEKPKESCSTSLLTTECGTVQQTVCTSAGGEATFTKAREDKDSKRRADDGKDRGDGKDHVERDHSSNSRHSERDRSKDDRDEGFGKPYGYHWEQNNGSGKPKQRKVTICHREGGSLTTLDVDDDGKYQGHHNHPQDTEGNCEHQDERTGKHKDDNNRGRDVVRIYKDETCGAPLPYSHKEPDGKHHQERDHESDKKDGNSKYRTRDTTQDDKDHAGRDIDLNKHRKGYRWEHDEVVTTTTGSGKNAQTTTTHNKQRKVTICHRMGGARVTIDVDDDGYFHGHSKHPMDTEGRCEDQDDKRGKHTDADNSGKDVVRIAAPDCNIPPGAPIVTPKACPLPPSCNAVGVTCTLLGTGVRPSRGGVRNMR